MEKYGYSNNALNELFRRRSQMLATEFVQLFLVKGAVLPHLVYLLLRLFGIHGRVICYVVQIGDCK